MLVDYGAENIDIQKATHRFASCATSPSRVRAYWRSPLPRRHCEGREEKQEGETQTYGFCFLLNLPIRLQKLDGLR